MRGVSGISAQGLELIGARALPEEVGSGAALRLALLWRAASDAPQTGQFTVKLARSTGEVVQETQLPVLGGRVQPSTLRAGNVVRDEQAITVSSRVPPETLAVQVVVRDQTASLGVVKVTGRAHTLATPSDGPVKADFGGVIGLQNARVQPASAKGGETVKVVINWRAEAEIPSAYKVFVHVLDPAGTSVVAQKDAEPQDGRAPTTSWLPNELVDDEFSIPLPAGLAAGDYPIELGLYDAKSGDRLRLQSGDSRVLLDIALHVIP
jgi:hypothetical protein